MNQPKIGESYTCIQNVEMNGTAKVTYTKGVQYKSEQAMCITDNSGRIGRSWKNIDITPWFRLVDISPKKVAVKYDNSRQFDAIREWEMDSYKFDYDPAYGHVALGENGNQYDYESAKESHEIISFETFSKLTGVVEKQSITILLGSSEGVVTKDGLDLPSWHLTGEQIQLIYTAYKTLSI